jgi:hypothetical protein
LDWDDQIVDPQWAAEKLSQWFSDLEDGGFNATIHQMHSPLLAPAGKGKDLSYESGVPWVRAKIVEPTAVKLIDEGVYRGFSIGILDPPIFADPKAKNGRIGAPGAGGYINEVSVVDTPANPRCLFSLAKRAKANKPIRETGVIEIVEDGQAIPLQKATREQLTKAFVHALSAHTEDGALTKVITAQLSEVGDPGAQKAQRRAAKIRAAAAYYALVKRDMDPDVGGGVDRDTLKPGDYVFSDTKDFPVVTPGDVTDAVSSWGRYKGSESFDSFKSKLTALARRKGPSFVKELPAAWDVKKGKKMTDTATKAEKTKAEKKPADSMPDGASKCGTCKGAKTIMDGNRECPKCKGKGYTMPGDDADAKAKAKVMGQVNAAADAAKRAGDVAGAAVGAATAAVVTKSLTKDADDDVDDAIEEIAEGLADAVDAQGDDLEEDPGKPSDGAVNTALANTASSVSALAAAQGADQVADVMGGKKKSKGEKVKKDKDMTGPDDDPSGMPAKPPKKGKKGKGAIPPQFAKEDEKPKKKGKKKKAKTGGDSTAIPAVTGVMKEKDDVMDAKGIVGTVGKGKKGKGKKKGMPSVEKRLHDILCPAYSTKSVKSAFGITKSGDVPLVEVLSPEWWGAQLADLTSARKKAGKDSVAEAYQALAASTKLTSLNPPTFLQLRDAAAKTFADSYPSVSVKPGVINPDDFHRPFLSSATDETSSVMRVPMPDLKGVFGPDDIDRGALTTNQSRPTLSGGSSVAKGKKSKGTTAGAGNPNSRQFYTNSAKDESQDAMSMLHDHIVNRYPGVCPMEAVMPGTDIDSDGQAGTAAEMQAKGPGVEELPTPTGAADPGTLRPIGKKKADKKTKTEVATAVGKGAGTAPPDTEAIRELVEGVLREERKVTKRKVKRLSKGFKRQLSKRDAALHKVLAQPNPTPFHRGASQKQFTPKLTVDSEKVEEAKQAAERIRVLKVRSRDGNSQVAQTAMTELMESLEPGAFAKVMAADPE